MRLRVGVPAAALILLAGNASLHAADDAGVRDAIRVAEERFARAEMAGDVDGMMEIYAEDAVLFPPGEDPIAGKNAATSWMRRRHLPAATISREQFQTSDLDVCADLAVETGTVTRQREAPGNAPTTIGTPYIAVWKRQSDGSWRIQKDMWSGPGSAGSTAALPTPRDDGAAPVPATPAPAASPASPVMPPPMAPPPDFLSIPDPRPLSEGFVRTIGDQLRARAGKIRALEDARSGEEARRAAIRRADRELQALIRDVGWIDVGRFGVATSCDAAFIVAESGDGILLKSTLPWMKDLQTNPEGAACYAKALDAYGKLPR